MLYAANFRVIQIFHRCENNYFFLPGQKNKSKVPLLIKGLGVYCYSLCSSLISHLLLIQVMTYIFFLPCVMLQIVV